MKPLVGIPGTISGDTRRLVWQRQYPDMPRITPGSTDGRVYVAVTSDGRLKAIVAREEVAPGKLLWHVSVSHADKDGTPDRVPTWDELKHAFYRLVQIDSPFVLIFPRRSTPEGEYVDIYSTCLHLWQAEGDVG